MSPEPLQRHKQINEACWDTLIFFFSGPFWAFFLGHLFLIFFCSEFWAPAEAEADQQGLLGYFYIFFSGRFFGHFSRPYFLNIFFSSEFWAPAVAGRSRSARPGRILWYQAHCPHHALHIMGQLRWAAFSWKISSSYCRADLNLSHPREMFRPNLQNFLDSQQNTIKTAFKFLHACTLEAKLCSR